MSKQEATVPAENARRDSSDVPLVDTAGAAVKQLIQLGTQRGYITYEELNATLPPDKNSSEQIEDIMAMISEMGINVVEDEENDDVPSTANGTQNSAGNTKGEEELGRTDDPVRMYLREMGTVELLSREGEIAIAKRIEAGRGMMIGSVCESPVTLQVIGSWHEAITTEQMLLREAIDLDATYGSSNNNTDNIPNGSSNVAEAAEEEDSEDDGADGDTESDSDEGNVPLSTMEEALLPTLVQTFGAISKIAKKVDRIQGQRLDQIFLVHWFDGFDLFAILYFSFNSLILLN